MIRTAVVALGLAALASSASAQPQHLDLSELPTAADDPPEVILLTFGVGARIFERFGHAALCVRHAGPHEAVCFNYGVTSFDDGAEMAWNFLRTEQKFWVEPEAWSAMVRFYEREDRDIWVQPLRLAPDRARDLERKLYSDLDEAHRYYVYDHFFDNCTTRLRDMIDTATAGALRAGATTAYPLSFRQAGKRGIAMYPPLVELVDFVLGRQLDDTPTLWQAMFLPDVLREQIARELGVAPQALYKRHGPAFPTEGSTFQLQTLLLVLVFAVPLMVARWRGRFERTALAWATAWLAFWGFVLWGLVAISSIPGVRWNEAVCVFVPLDVALPFLAVSARRSYARWRVVGLLLVSALCAVGMFHQPLWIPIISAIVPLAIVAFGAFGSEPVSAAGESAPPAPPVATH